MAKDLGSGEHPWRPDRPGERLPGANGSFHPPESGESRTGTPDAEPSPTTWLMRLEHRSPDPAICPFLRSADDGGVLGMAVGTPDAVNRCAALRDAVPQSLRQQELVCLTSGHVNCPRYLRGTVEASEQPKRDAHRRTWPSLAGLAIGLPRRSRADPDHPAAASSTPDTAMSATPTSQVPAPEPPPVLQPAPAPATASILDPGARADPAPTVPAPAVPPPPTATRAAASVPTEPVVDVSPVVADPARRRGSPTAMTPAIFGATLVLLASFSGSIAYVVANGGLTMPVAVVRDSPAPSALAVVPSAEPTVAPTVAPTPSPQPSPTPSPTLEPTPEPTAQPTPEPTPKPTPRKTPKPKPKDPILAKFPELKRCPGRSNCYIYIVEPGNNLYSIANYYRVSYDRVLAMNPYITNPANIHTGDPIRMPTPQRPRP